MLRVLGETAGLRGLALTLELAVPSTRCHAAFDSNLGQKLELKAL